MAHYFIFLILFLFPLQNSSFLFHPTNFKLNTLFIFDNQSTIQEFKDCLIFTLNFFKNYDAKESVIVNFYVSEFYTFKATCLPKNCSQILLDIVNSEEKLLQFRKLTISTLDESLSDSIFHQISQVFELGVRECFDDDPCEMDKRTSLIVTNADSLSIGNMTRSFKDPPLIKTLYRYLFTTSKNFTIDENDYLKWFWIYDKVPDSQKVNNMLWSFIDYPFNIVDNRYNFFIALNQSALTNATILLRTIIELNDFAVVEPLQAYYAHLLVVNETHSFETEFLWPSVTNQTIDIFLSFQNECSRSLQPDWPYYKPVNISEYSKIISQINQIFDPKNGDFKDNKTANFQSNVVISDVFPFWILQSNMKLDSWTRFMDIYIITNNDTIKQAYSDLSENMNKILIHDENSTLRSNHIMVLLSILSTWDHGFTDRQNNSFIPSLRNHLVSYYYTKKVERLFDEGFPWDIVWTVVVIGFILSCIVGLNFIYQRWRLKKKSKKLAKRLAKTLQLSSHQAQLFDQIEEEFYIDEKRLQIDFNSIIGKGATATVYAGKINGVAPLATKIQTLETRRFENCRVAVKIGNQMGRDQIEQLIREVDAGRQILFHPHICTLLAWTLHKGLPALIYDAIEDGDLLNFAKKLQDSEKDFPHKKILQILWQICDALKHITSLGLVHRDVAARNVLLGSGNVAKLADFGLCSACDESFTYHAKARNKLPIRWLSPEAMVERLFSEASDVWSFGVLIWEVYAKGATPFGEFAAGEILPFLQQGGRLAKPVAMLDEELWSSCLECWQMDKEKRPKFIELQKNIGAFLEKNTENYGYLGFENE